jgi:hypothetical protein
VNKSDRGGKKPGGSGRGKTTNKEPARKGGRGKSGGGQAEGGPQRVREKSRTHAKTASRPQKEVLSP